MAILRKSSGRKNGAGGAGRAGNTGRTGVNDPAPLPKKLVAVLQESRWLVLIALCAFLTLSLWGYRRGDPGWSHAASHAMLSNPAGRSGAWLADLLLYVFGLSAWWWVVFLLAFIWWGYRRLDGLRGADRRPVYIALAGFVLLMLSSCGLEALRFHSLSAQLPLAPGGMLGVELGNLSMRYLGYTGATITLLALWMLGWSVFSGMSWLNAAECIGAVLEMSVTGVYRLFDLWQDRRIGREVAREREARVEDEKQRMPPHEPIFVEAPDPVIKRSAKADKRIERERQAALFPEAVVGGLLPPLHLLEPAPESTEQVDVETLEYTSRLIERKLGEFGVQVKVLAAYPGPVITRYEIEPAVGVKGAQIVNLSKDLARALSMVSIRVVETVPGKSCMALELPNARRQTVRSAWVRRVC